MKTFTFKQVGGHNKKYHSYIAAFLILGSSMQAITLQDLQSNISNLHQQQTQSNAQLQSTLDKQKQEQAQLEQKLQEQQKQYDNKQAELEAQKQTHQKEEAMLDNKLKEQQKQYDDKQAEIDQLIRDAFKLWQQKLTASTSTNHTVNETEIQKKIDENLKKNRTK